MSLSIDFTHHAHLIRGDVTDVLPQLKVTLKKQGIDTTSSNSDYREYVFDVCTIDDARMLRDEQLRKTLEAKQIFIVGWNTITREAQNALLKTFEEPTSDTYFFVITPNTDRLLPTVRSRFITLAYDRISKDTTDIQAFVVQDIPERLAYMQPMIEAKDKQQASIFVKKLHTYFDEHLRDYTSDEVHNIQNILRVSEYINDQSSSLKMILEYIALTAPTR